MAEYARQIGLVPGNEWVGLEQYSRDVEDMAQRSVFLTAEWRNLLMLNYAIDPLLLKNYVPRGTELDQFDGARYVSLVAFEFLRTRIGGFRIPVHHSFEEVNLRFYVRRGERRGVVFIRELVPRFAIAAVARIFFGENYSRVKMAHTIESRNDAVRAEFSWGRGDGACAMQVVTEGQPFFPAEGSLSEFITEHYWGYAKQRDGGCVEYEVQHPRWLVRSACSAKFSGDARAYYGGPLAALLSKEPDSAFLAEGSPVTVYRGTRIDSDLLRAQSDR